MAIGSMSPMIITSALLVGRGVTDLASRMRLNLAVELPPCFRLWGVVPQNALHRLAIVVGRVGARLRFRRAIINSILG